MMKIDKLPEKAKLIAVRHDWNGDRLHLLYKLPDGQAVFHNLAEDQMFLEQSIDVALSKGYWTHVDVSPSEE